MTCECISPFERINAVFKYDNDDQVFDLLLKHLADNNMDDTKWKQYKELWSLWVFNHPEDSKDYYDLRVKYADEIIDWDRRYHEFIKSF